MNLPLQAFPYFPQRGSAGFIVNQVKFYPAYAPELLGQAVVDVIPVLFVFLQKVPQIVLILNADALHPQVCQPGTERFDLFAGGMYGGFNPLHVQAPIFLLSFVIFRNSCIGLASLVY